MRIKQRRRVRVSTNIALAVLLINGLSAVTTVAVAQVATQTTESSEKVETVTVTAEKRPLALLKTPASITAVTEAQIQEKGIMDLQDLYTAVPNLTYSLTGVTPQVYIRGIGFENLVLGGDPGVAYHVDGVYMSRPSAALGDYFDVNRVEVLRGPQGTLYGRNATGGVINVITNEPSDDWELAADAEYGNYNTRQFHLVVNAPIDDDIAAVRVAAYDTQHDGYTLNLFNGKHLDDTDARGIRTQALLKPTSNFEVLLEADYNIETDSGPLYKVVGPFPPGYVPGAAPNPLNPRKIDINTPETQHNKVSGTTAHINWNLGGVTLTSISAYEYSDVALHADGDGSNIDLTDLKEDDLAHQFTQELRLASNDQSPFQWILGGYYLYEDVERNSPITLYGFIPYFFHGYVKTSSYAAFANATYQLTDTLQLIAGARYTSDTKDGFEQSTFFGFPLIGPDFPKGSWGDTTWRAGLQYNPTDKQTWYGTVSTGFKAGGLNIGSGQPPFAPEKIISGEAGYKTLFDDDHIQFTSSVFYDKYTDLQVFQLIPPPINSFEVENAAAATIYGAELEGQAILSDNFKIDASVGYLHARFDKYLSVDQNNPGLGVQNLAGNRLSRAPDWTIHAGPEYLIPVASSFNVRLREDTFFQSTTYYRAFNTPQDRVGPIYSVDLYAIIEPTGAYSNWWARLYMKNVTNQANITDLQPAGAVYFETLSPPRTFGIQIGVKY